MGGFIGNYVDMAGYPYHEPDPANEARSAEAPSDVADYVTRQ